MVVDLKTTAPATRAGVLDTVRCAGLVLAPMVAQGPIRRRNRVVRLVQALGLERRGTRLLRRLRDRHGPGPLRLALPGRSVALVLDEGTLTRVLGESPEPFALAQTEKVAALGRFEPHAVLVSTGAARTQRGRFNETVLDADRPLHRAADAIADAVRDEAERLQSGPVLDWAAFSAMFDRVVRRVVLGAAARDDTRLTAELNRLRDQANWAQFRPRDEHLRARFQHRVDAYVAQAEPGSLVGTMAATPAAGGVDPAGQVPHWLFAFDAAGITAFRTLILLGCDPGRQIVAAGDKAPLYPYLRACVLDTVRLWPTTLAVLRESTEPTDWGGVTLPARTSFVVPSGHFHRDPTALHQADAFDPEAWLAGAGRRTPSLFPFSAGPGECPGRNVALLTTSTLLAVLLRRLQPLRTLRPLRAPLPATFDHTRARLRVAARP